MQLFIKGLFKSELSLSEACQEIWNQNSIINPADKKAITKLVLKGMLEITLEVAVPEGFTLEDDTNFGF